MWQIIKNEWLYLSRTKLLVVISFGFVLVLLLSIILGKYETQQQQQSYQTASNHLRQQWESIKEMNPHGAAHYGTYVFKPTNLLSSLDEGVNSITGNVLRLEGHVQNEIVHSDLGVDPRVRTGKHLKPTEFKQLLKNDPDVVLVDMRSNYEHELGRFKGAYTFDMENLRDLPDHVQEIAHLKDKKVITYCTGGIKCEKASAYLIEKGFTDVYKF